jgi:magnesium transporter
MGRKTRKEIREKKQSKVGAPPGSSIYVGADRTALVEIELHSYDLNSVKVQTGIELNQLDNLPQNLFHWVNINGVHNVATVNEIAMKVGIHALTVEDILNTVSRPKCEIYEDYVFTSLKMLKNELPDILVEDEQVSIILKKNVVISFQEIPGDIFQPIRDRLQNPESRARRKKSDYLFFLLQDIIVDNYIEVVDLLEESNQLLEKSILDEVNSSQLVQIQKLKSEVLYLKRVIFPVKESLAKIIRSDCRIIEPETKIFFNDVLDHLAYTHDSIESQFEIIVGHRELYMSMMSINMNNVMKVLTIISSIFIPLTFIAGVYGMNFEHMPELRMQNGYFITLGIMAILTIVMVVYFKRKKWM